MYYMLMHKTGKYVVEVVEDKGNESLVSIVNVINHPAQGDLHSRNEVENVFFHERKALSHREKRIVSNNLLKRYDGEVLSYEDSLQQALSKLEEKLKINATPFNIKSLACLNTLKQDYTRQYKTTFQ